MEGRRGLVRWLVMGGRKGRENVDSGIESGGRSTVREVSSGEWVEKMWVAAVWRSIGWGDFS